MTVTVRLLLYAHCLDDLSMSTFIQICIVISCSDSVPQLELNSIEQVLLGLYNVFLKKRPREAILTYRGTNFFNYYRTVLTIT